MTISTIYEGEYRFKGLWNSDCICYLHIYRTKFDDIVLCTETSENEGTSITNFAENLATQIVNEFNLIPERLIWIEHYTKESYKDRNRAEEYSIVHFHYDGKQFTLPNWTYISKDEYNFLINQKAGL